MKLKNIEIEDFVVFLMNLELVGKSSRMRTRFVKILGEQQQLIQEENTELIKQYAVLDENGEPEKVENDGKYYYDIKKENRVEYNREYFILMNEDFIISQDEKNEEILTHIKDVILNCEMTFKGVEAIKYDRWCEIVEQIEY